MGKLSIARELAEVTGKSLGEARRFVDDVGVQPAKRLADDAAARGSQTVKNWGPALTVGGGALGGGALYWREQEVNQAQAIANQEQEFSSALQSIMDSDLSPEAKRDMAESLVESQTAENEDGGGGGPDLPFSGDGDGGPFGSLQQTAILLVVLAFVFRYTLGEDN